MGLWGLKWNARKGNSWTRENESGGVSEFWFKWLMDEIIIHTVYVECGLREGEASFSKNIQFALH